MKCPKCSADNWTMVSQLGALETWRCNACGNEETRHVNFAEAPELPIGREPILEVFVRWTDKPEAAQVAELHKTFPRLRKLSVIDLLKAARETGRLSVGRFTETELAPLRPKLKALGVALEGTEL